MRERKVVKFRVDMYDDTKFKIIDMKPERDLIHYIWTRLVTLAGKVNLEGDLYISKNIPYTIETLGIEFNRNKDQIKLALDVLMELEMIEITLDNIFRVKNFAKHQNIKVKEKNEDKDKGEIKNKEVKVNGNLKKQINDNEDEESENKIIKMETENIRKNNKDNIEISRKDIEKIHDNISDEKVNNSQDKIPILLENKKSKKTNKKKNKVIHLDNIEENEDNEIICFYDGDLGRPLAEGESVTKT